MGKISAINTVSKEAAAVHYASSHDEPPCIIFSRDGIVRYAIKSGECPWLIHAKSGEKLPLGLKGLRSGLGSFEEYNARDWTSGAAPETGDDVQVQTFGQNGGFAMTLLWFTDAGKEDDDLGIDDAFDRFAR